MRVWPKGAEVPPTLAGLHWTAGMERVARFIEAYSREHGAPPPIPAIAKACSISRERARQLRNKIERWQAAPRESPEFAAKRRLAANFYAVLPLIEAAALGVKQPPPQRLPLKPPPPPSRICEVCGAEFFKPKGLHAVVFAARRYCSTPCKDELNGVVHRHDRDDLWSRNRRAG
jgi:hypothetical protein